MSSTNSPRRHSPAVYRRRRLMVFVLLVLIVALVSVLIAQPWSRGRAAESSSQSNSSSQSQSPATSALPSASSAAPASVSASPSASQAPAKPGECSSSDLAVSASTDKSSYSSSQNPVLSITVKNTSGSTCTFDAGSANLNYVVTSGKTRVWQFQDCVGAGSSTPMTIDAGSSKTAPFTWKRQPSAAGQCQANANKRITAAGAYWLTVSLGKVTSDGVQFLLK